MAVDSIPEHVWDVAKRKADILRPLALRQTCPSHLARSAAADLGISERWVYALVRRMRAQDGRLTALLPSEGRGGPGKPRLAASREAIIQEVIESSYLTRQKLGPVEIVKEIRSICSKRGVPAPSDATIRRRLRDIPLDTRSRRREADLDALPAGGRTPIPDFPLDAVQMDHTLVDVIIVDPVCREPIGRPYLTVAIDVMSRALVGFHLSLDAPSATSVGLCLTHVAADKSAWLAARGVAGAEWPIAGKPKKIGVDNAVEFHSQAFERGCAQHGIEIDWRPPGQPWFGGIVERVIGTLMRRIHRLPGTTFSNVAERGAYDSDKHACLTLEELERWLAVAICKEYHRSAHRGIGGTTPLGRLKDRLAALHDTGGGIAIPRDMRSYLIDFLPVLRRTLRRDGFTIDHIRYFSNALKPWIASRDARTCGPQILRRDPRDLSRIYLLDPIDGGYVEVPYRTLSRPAITLWEHQAALRRARERNASEVDETAIFAAFDEMQQIERTAERLSRKTRRRKARPAIERAEAPNAERRSMSGDEPTHETAAISPDPFPDIEEW